MKGDCAIYLDSVTLGQLIPAKNNPENIGKYKCKQDDFLPIYDIINGKFLGQDARLVFVMVRATLTRPSSCMTNVNLTSSVIWPKGESQNGGNKNTKHLKFSKKRTFFTP